jgi:hypothetical protein
MKNRVFSSLQAAAVAMACWLLPTLGLGSVLVDGLSYELDEAAKTAVVVSPSSKSIDSASIPGSITYEGITYTVTAIADCAFLDCRDLLYVYIESPSLTYIGFSAFERCYSLEYIGFVDGLTEIQYEAFKDCRNLSRVILPSSLRAIGDRSFLGCIHLSTINIPAKVDYIGEQCLSGCPVNLLMAEGKKTLPIKERSFTGIEKENCLLGVPEGSKAAYQAADVWKDFLSIRDDVVEVDKCGNYVYYVIFGDMTMKVYGKDRMFDFWHHSIFTVYKDDIEEVTIEEGVTHLGAEALIGYDKLSTINVPNSLTSIGQYAVSYTPWYDNQPDGVVYLGKLVYGLKGMEGADVVLLDGTLGHSASAFYDCNISSLSIPSSMTYIDPIMYYHYEYEKFYGAFCSIGSIVVDAANPLYDSRDDCNAIIETASNTVVVGSQNMNLPESVTAIGPFVCGTQTSVVIPSSVTVVDNFAFCSKLETLNWNREDDPGYIFFAHPTPLSSIKMVGSVPPALSITNPALDKTYKEEYKAVLAGPDKVACILYVPFGSKEAYQSAPGWKDFQNIEEYDPEEGGTTAIETVRESTSAPRQIFDLQGRRLNDTSSHSIIIENGRKRIQR